MKQYCKFPVFAILKVNCPKTCGTCGATTAPKPTGAPTSAGLGPVRAQAAVATCRVVSSAD